MYSSSRETFFSISCSTSTWNQRNCIGTTTTTTTTTTTEESDELHPHLQEASTTEGVSGEPTTPSISAVSLLWVSEIWIRTSPRGQTETLYAYVHQYDTYY